MKCKVYRGYQWFAEVKHFIQEDEVYPFGQVSPLMSGTVWNIGVANKVKCE